MRRGIDVSHYQGDIDWRRVHEAGVSRVYLKCSEYHRDKRLDEYLDGMRRYIPDPTRTEIDPIEHGLYHLWHGDLGVCQVDELIDTYIVHPTISLPPAIDLEHSALSDATRGQLEELIASIIRVQECLGMGVMVYVSARGREHLLADGRWAQIWALGYTRLWMMRREEHSEDMTLAGAPPWSWHQWTSDGRLDGVQLRVDLNWVRDEE
jgi:lysozyme